MDDGGSVTLVFYSLSKKWWKEPTLNILAAAMQMSNFTHVEIALGSDPGAQGQMTNVCRVFNDDIGKHRKKIGIVPTLYRDDNPPALRCRVDGSHRKESTVSDVYILYSVLETRLLLNEHFALTDIAISSWAAPRHRK
jgi:hypothetical protein